MMMVAPNFVNKMLSPKQKLGLSISLPIISCYDTNMVLYPWTAGVGLGFANCKAQPQTHTHSDNIGGILILENSNETMLLTVNK